VYSGAGALPATMCYVTITLQYFITNPDGWTVGDVAAVPFINGNWKRKKLLAYPAQLNYY